MPAQSEEDLLLATGELRPDLLRLFRDPGPQLDVLLGSPGLLPPSGADALSIARNPAGALSIEQAHQARRRALEFLASELDRLPQTVEWESLVHEWLSRLHAGSIQVRAFERAPLFTRLVSRPGSSVFTAAPIALPGAQQAQPVDLHLELGAEANAQARRWFGDRWDEAAEISSEVYAALAESWAGKLVAPEDLYFKVLADYFQPILEGMDREVEDNPLIDVMTDFQLAAYQYAKSILRRYGGVFLADVVGLGKTFIALALLRHLQDRYGEHAVVIAPPAICPTWADLAAEFHVELVTLSHGKLEDLDRHADREILVVDESHNFRNPSTQRQERLQHWLRPDDTAAARKVILVSATPQNNRPRDLLQQLRMFPDTRTRLPFPGESLEKYFRSVEQGSESLTTLLQHVVVRRTRRFIQKAYPEQKLRRRIGPGRYVEEPLRFPTRVSGPDQCLRYCIDESYAEGLYQRIMTALASMAYALYGLADYLKPEYADDDRFAGLGRAGRSLRGLFKVLLLKRLESSVEAFRLTLRRLRARLDRATRLLAEGWVEVRQGRNAPTSIEELEEEGSASGTLNETTAFFDVLLLETALGHDELVVDQLLEMVERIDPAKDAKLQRLREYLRARPPVAHRTVLFTQFGDTAAYLARELATEFGRSRLVTGSSGGALAVVRHFAPVANRATIPQDLQIDLLISTDALSEGVNLQDADTLINYDIHWNPVRLIQRAGRIDRIGSTNEEIHVASFLPERGLEAKLGLEAVVRARIREFLQVFGEDSHVLPRHDEDLEEHAVVDAYTGTALQRADEDEEIDALGYHAEKILSLRRANPARYDAILRLRPGRRSLSAASRPAVTATRLGWYWRFWRLGAEGSCTPLDDRDGLELFARHAEQGPLQGAEEARDEREALGEFVEQARSRFLPLAETVRSQRQQPRLEPTEEWLRSLLEEYRHQCVAGRQELIEQMIHWLLSGQHKAVLRRRSTFWRREQLPGEAVFAEMRVLLRQFPLLDEELGEPLVVGSVFGGASTSAGEPTS